MTRYGLLVVAALVGLGLGSHGARAFTIINSDNYARGGTSGLALANPDAPPGAKTNQSTSGLSFGVSGGDSRFSNGPGYAGYGALDFSNGSTAHDNFPTFPGQDNHLTAGENAGILQYGAIPRHY